jgi:hypothetical protein
MKKFILIIFFCLAVTSTFAQAVNDSVAYQAEHAKINAMLARRAQKFGQYDQSLTMHSGIFGMQTKNDIRRSNDILMDIVKTDDSVYRELKILFEYSIYQRDQVQNRTEQSETSNFGYMTTINKLRNQIETVKAEAEKQQDQYQKTKVVFIIGLLVMFGLIVYLLSRKKKTGSISPS